MGLKPPVYVHDVERDPDDPRAGGLLDPDADLPADVALLGVPFDDCVPGRKGASQGPEAIREALRYNTTYDAVRGVDLDGTTIADLGDLEVAGDPEDVHADLIDVVADVREDVETLILLGGDHSLTHPTAKAWAGDRSLGLLYVDAHLDVRRFPPFSSGNSFRRLIDDGVVDGTNLVNVGARPFLNSRYHVDFAEDAGARIVPPSTLRRRDVHTTIDDAVSVAEAGTDALYFSLDVDGVDQSHACGVSAPSPGGLAPREVFQIARTMGRAGAEVIDVCEVAPRLDPTGNTSRVAATAVLHFLAGSRL